MDRKKLKDKLKLDNAKFEELKGFEDIIDILLEEDENKAKENERKIRDRYGETYELYNFLESERDRLRSINDFLSIKVKNMQQFSQTELLASHQKNKLQLSRKKVLNALNSENSIVKEQIKMLFNKNYKKYSD